MDLTKFKMATLVLLLLLLTAQSDMRSKGFKDSGSEGRNTNTTAENEGKTTFTDRERNATVFKGHFAILDNAPNLVHKTDNNTKLENDSSSNDFKSATDILRINSDLGQDRESYLRVHNTNLTDEKRHQLLMKRRKQCVHLPNFHSKWIEMIATCPKYYSNRIIKSLCHRSSKPASRNNQTQHTDSENSTILNIQNLPVQDDEGTVYGNIYCAVCNEITSLHMMDVLVECNQTTSLRIFDGGKEFSIFQSVPMGRCEQIFIPSNPNRIQTCRPDAAANHHFRIMTRGDPGLGQSSLKYPVSFTVLMNFGFDGKTHVLFSNTHVEIERYVEKKCSSAKEVFVAQLNSCRKVHCSEGYSLTRIGCVARGNKKKLNLLQSSQADKILDSQTLANLDNIAHVSLEMNITYGDLRSLMSPDLETKMIDGISGLLNINRDRIQNLTITILNDSVSGNHVHIHMIPKTKFENKPSVHKNIPISNKIRVKEPSSSNGKHNSLSGKHHQNSFTNSKSHFKDNSRNNPISGAKAKHNPKTRFKGKPKTKLTAPMVSINDIKSTKRKTNSKSRPINANKVYLKKRKVKTNFVKSSKQDTIDDAWTNSSTTIRVSFLLLPSRNGSRSEKTVSSLVQKIKEVIADEKFTLIINETVIQVVNNNKETDHWLGTDFCNTGVPVTVFSDDFELLLPNPSKGRNVTQVYVNRTRTLYGPGQYQMSIIVQHSGDVTSYDGFVIVCSMPRIADDSCRRVEIPKGEFVLLANRSVTVSGKVYDTNEYSYVNEDLTTIEICIPGDLDRPRKQQGRFFVVPGCDRGFEAFIKADSYLTDILGRVSIVALAIVLLTYILFKSLRNLAGTNIMNLTLALLVSETVFALGEDTQESWLCSTIAISLHYFVLASFFWMNIMAYDVHNTLVMNSFSVGTRGADKFGWRYALYGWGAPFLIVATCVVLDFTHVVSGLRIGYGKMTSGPIIETSSNEYDTSANTTNGKRLNETSSHSQGCWIQSPEAALYVFGAPILVIFIVNGFFFFKTILSIQQTTKLAHLKTRRSSVHSVSGRREVILYVRLSTVMGFTWIFGLASSLVSVITTTPTSAICYTVHLLAILFTIFNCSHGFFIFFAFIVKKRVLYMYKSLWNRIQNRSMSPFFTRSTSKSGFQ